jgi:hypothetical protein
LKCGSVSYSNFALINNSSEELVLNRRFKVPAGLRYYYPRQGGSGSACSDFRRKSGFSRIALSPRNAKLFLQGLAERMKKYEDQYGPIKPPEALEVEAMNAKKVQ